MSCRQVVYDGSRRRTIVNNPKLLTTPIGQKKGKINYFFVELNIVLTNERMDLFGVSLVLRVVAGKMLARGSVFPSNP